MTDTDEIMIITSASREHYVRPSTKTSRRFTRMFTPGQAFHSASLAPHLSIYHLRARSLSAPPHRHAAYSPNDKLHRK
ncbi:hypothetical protein E2C01_070765 [Portunus trituberculatus]|uniref:Uncharacterized protein n=1 Tax=Portunus trituberculatus TaxID=210409 RepID=A0A5B7I2I7_PORTR|nr:hypothetical protein [Portunus trituberculatus]